MAPYIIYAEPDNQQLIEREPCDPSIVLFLLPICVMFIKYCIDYNLITEILNC